MAGLGSRSTGRYSMRIIVNPSQRNAKSDNLNSEQWTNNPPPTWDGRCLLHQAEINNDSPPSRDWCNSVLTRCTTQYYLTRWCMDQQCFGSRVGVQTSGVQRSDSKTRHLKLASAVRNDFILCLGAGTPLLVYPTIPQSSQGERKYLDPQESDVLWVQRTTS